MNFAKCRGEQRAGKSSARLWQESSFSLVWHLPWGSECNRLFYKRGCQGTFFSLHRRRVYFPRLPALSPWKALVWCRALGLVCVVPCQQVLLGCDNAGRFLKRSKRCGCTVSTMVLSEARGLVLFRVVRGGIGFTQRLGCARHRGAYRRLAYSPSNPSVSRTNQPLPEKIK